MAEGTDQDIAGLQARINQLESEAARRAVIDRIRSVIGGLSDEDYEVVLEALFEALTELAVPCHGFGVNVLNRGDRAVTQVFREPSGWVEYRTMVGVALITQFQGADSPTYRRDLAEDDPYDEAIWALDRTPPIRSVLDVPWSRGTLAINSPEPDAFCPRDIDALAMLAAVLSEAFVRVDDLVALKDANQRTLPSCTVVSDGWPEPSRYASSP
ncbi:MAG: hypothetical protein QF689_12930 [Candidatus Latescibacteria bacterium]|jgi:hypothetical protein|nr:hypothetical protein [Candidatus Latescibacterota bacterium]MDP7449489.1 hypothetical protein [Candidatus Latescibacterota bacterium]HJP33587.1 hypothetical protein [Candidatus Latescibacterota bacterium]